MSLICNGQEAPVDFAGGKGHYLLRLSGAAKEPDSIFEVPPFFVIPVGDATLFECHSAKMQHEEEVRTALARLQKPVIARSSSVLEDGIRASFAGVFHSEPDVQDYQGLLDATYSILVSEFSSQARKVAETVGMEWQRGMGIIVQEQVGPSDFQGTLELNRQSSQEYRIVVEGQLLGQFYQDSRRFDETFYDDLDPLLWITERPQCRSFQGMDRVVLEMAVIQARKKLGLGYPVQAEMHYQFGRKPQLVQIRQLPKIPEQDPALALATEFEVPSDVPRIYCPRGNGIAGDVVLPAYVTLSNYARYIFYDDFEFEVWGHSPKRETFSDRSKLGRNTEFTEWAYGLKRGYNQRTLDRFAEKLLRIGNKLFPEYALVCDKLDNTCIKMNNQTTNKRAIITTHDITEISHALTVSRELGIVGLATTEDLRDFDSFLHQIQTGDLIHIKSDGKQGVAYLERRRE